jgi:hypothetical protein
MSLEFIGVVGSIFFVGCGLLMGFIIWGTETKEGWSHDHLWSDDKDEKN